MIIAVDFDNTLTAPSKYPITGALNYTLIEKLKQVQAAGHTVILWTCREGEDLAEAIALCACAGLSFDAVNENYPPNPHYPNCRKIYADLYLDDRAINVNHMPTALYALDYVCKLKG